MKNKIELALHLLQSNKPAQLVRHVGVGDGIVQLEGSLLLEAIQKYEKNYTRINIEKFLQTDGTTGYVPRTALPKYFSDLLTSMTVGLIKYIL